MQHTPYNDKHQGWIVDCPECGISSPCQMCDGDEWIEATLDDFDGETVRLNDGTVGMIVCFGKNAWLIDANDNEHDAPDVADIAAVLEEVAA